MPHNTSISEFERQKQDRIVIIKDLIRNCPVWNPYDHDCAPFLKDERAEKVLSKLVKSILIEIDKV